MKYRNGILLVDGGAIYVPVGFIPDKVDMYEMTTDGIMHVWHRVLEDSDVDAALSSIEGLQYDVDGGAATLLADGGGFASYNTAAEKPTITEWASAVSTAATARTATAPGTFIKPTASAVTADGLVADRSLIAECVTAGTSSGTEPTWASATGEQFLDSDVRFEIVNQATYRNGYQGFRVAAALMTDGDYHIYDAWMADQVDIWGDVDGWTDGIHDRFINP